MSAINKDLIQQRFEKQLNCYRQHASVQEQMADKLARQIAALLPDDRIERLLEVGAGSAGLTEALLGQIRVDSYFANDLVAASAAPVESILQRHRVRQSDFLAGDIEQIGVPQNLDLIVSGATLQWLDDLRLFLKRMATALNPEGRLCFSSFGPDNMREIRQLTAVGLDYLSLDQLRQLIAPWFDIEYLSEERHTLDFDSPLAVLRHISKTGVSGWNRNPWTKSRQRSFVEAYKQSFASDNGVRLTYHCIYCCLRKKADEVTARKTGAMEMASGW